MHNTDAPVTRCSRPNKISRVFKYDCALLTITKKHQKVKQKRQTKICTQVYSRQLATAVVCAEHTSFSSFTDGSFV